MPPTRSAARWILAVVLLTTGPSLCLPVFAGRKIDDGDRPYWRTNLFKRAATDQKFLVTRWWPREFQDPVFASTLGVGLAMVIGSNNGDDRSRDAAWEPEISAGASSGVKSISHAFTTLGSAPVIAVTLGLGYVSARHAHDERVAEASSLAAESVLDAAIWMTVLKYATARVRPYESDGGSFFQYGHAQAGSFPSGHAMASFSVAAAFAESFPEKKWVPWISYGLATLVSASRLALGRHFPGDVVVGAVLGTSIGRGVAARSAEETPRRKGTVGPVMGPEGRGVGIGWSYCWK